MPHLGLRRKLLENAVMLGDALKIACAWEVAAQQSRQMDRPIALSSEPAAPASSAVHAVSARRQQSRGQPSSKTECAKCGHKGHRAGDSACPAKGKTCKKCGKLNHFAVKCRSTPGSGDASQRFARQPVGCLAQANRRHMLGMYQTSSKQRRKTSAQSQLYASSISDHLPPKHLV